MFNIGTAYTSTAFPNQIMVVIGIVGRMLNFMIVDSHGQVMNTINISVISVGEGLENGKMKKVGKCKAIQTRWVIE